MKFKEGDCMKYQGQSGRYLVLMFIKNVTLEWIGGESLVIWEGGRVSYEEEDKWYIVSYATEVPSATPHHEWEFWLNQYKYQQNNECN